MLAGVCDNILSEHIYNNLKQFSTPTSSTPDSTSSYTYSRKYSPHEIIHHGSMHTPFASTGQVFPHNVPAHK